MTIESSRPGRRAALQFLSTAAMAAGLAACGPRPGERHISSEFLDGMPEASFMEANARLLQKSFGGRYMDDRLHNYVAAVGRLLGGESSGQSASYSFTILNSPTVNIFALPDGRIYLTRGLLAQAGSEAELAGALSTVISLKETGRLRKHWNDWLYETRLGEVQRGLLKGTDLYDLTELQLTPVLSPLPLAEMRDADKAAASRMLAAGYDPMALVQLADAADQSAKLEAVINQIPGQLDRVNYARLYPREVDVLAGYISGMKIDPATPPSTDRILYLSQIDGMVFGSDPAVGYLDEGYYVAPGLGLTFQVPPGYNVAGGVEMATAFGPDGSGFSVDLSEDPRLPRADVYLREVLGRQLYLRKLLRGIERVRINDMEGATGVARIYTDDGAMDMRLVVVRVGRNHMARMIFLTPAELTQSLGLDLRRTTYSLRPLLPGEGGGFRAHRLRVVTVRDGDNLAALSRQLPYRAFKSERLATLNGMPPDAILRSGERLKVIVG